MSVIPHPQRPRPLTWWRFFVSLEWRRPVSGADRKVEALPRDLYYDVGLCDVRSARMKNFID